MKTFKSNAKVIGSMNKNISVEMIKNEEMIFNGDRDFALEEGGLITQSFVYKFLDPNKDWIIDSRVHMLMEDWYPCIGGWHLDDVPRDELTGQPNIHNPEYIAEHILCVIDIGTGSLTQFLSSDVDLPHPPKDKMVYEYYNKEIEENRRFGGCTTFYPNRSVISFDSNTFHRGTPALKSGWRFFIRATTNTNRKPANEIRRQSNVYLDTNKGW